VLQAERRRRYSSIQFALTITCLALLFVLALAAITREAVGEPVLPEQLAQALHQPQVTLPSGLTYDFEIVDPLTRRPLAALPDQGTAELRLAVTNDSALPMTLRFATSEQCEFIVRRVSTYVYGLFALPLEIWRSTYFHNILRTPTKIDLAPGQTHVFVSYWYFEEQGPQQAPPGDYRIVARFYGATFPLRIDKPN
jgi:hypothetical protein